MNKSIADTAFKEIPMSLRTYGQEQRYQQDKLDGKTIQLKNEPSIWQGLFWRMIRNRYWADVAFKQNDANILLPKRVVSDWWKLYPWEMVELLIIFYKHRFDGSQITLNLGDTRSVPGHLHFHLNTFYDTRDDMQL